MLWLLSFVSGLLCQKQQSINKPLNDNRWIENSDTLMCFDTCGTTNHGTHTEEKAKVSSTSLWDTKLGVKLGSGGSLQERMSPENCSPMLYLLEEKLGKCPRACVKCPAVNSPCRTKQKGGPNMELFHSVLTKRTGRERRERGRSRCRYVDQCRPLIQQTNTPTGRKPKKIR